MIDPPLVERTAYVAQYKLEMEVDKGNAKL
jgi:hypothetical protein